jgi:hypothetical protein
MRYMAIHDADCPLGENGLRAYSEATDALMNLPPEARATTKDRADIAQALFELETKQVCRCVQDDRHVSQVANPNPAS